MNREQTRVNFSVVIEFVLSVLRAREEKFELYEKDKRIYANMVIFHHDCHFLWVATAVFLTYATSVVIAEQGNHL